MNNLFCGRNAGKRGDPVFSSSEMSRLGSPPGSIEGPAARLSPRLLVSWSGSWAARRGVGEAGCGSWISISQVPPCSCLATSGTFDVPLKSAPSVNINSLVLIPLEAHEWNKHILNWLCHEVVSCQDWAPALGSRRGDWREGGPCFPRGQTFGLVGSKPPRAVLSGGTKSHC